MDPNKIESGIRLNIPLKVFNTVSVINDFTVSILLIHYLKMGIPSYYKKLIDVVPGLVSSSKKDIQWLFMDFNCLIYHCINDDYKEDLKEEWENNFLDSIVKYCLNVIKEVNPLIGVFIAIDGVVPMAKMRQQRLRRFKSAWTKTVDATWDKNAITPGTVFMGKLKERLQSLNYILSSSDEPGEGEHKIIAEWRKGTYKGNYAVYGLDADLIVLSMLGHECCNLNNIWLFREDINLVFNWFSINLLKDWLCSRFERKREFILNYCFALSILGNDFLPSSLGLKMREDGHSKLLDIVESLTLKKICLIDPVSLGVVTGNVMILFKMLSARNICTVFNGFGLIILVMMYVLIGIIPIIYRHYGNGFVHIFLVIRFLLLKY